MFLFLERNNASILLNLVILFRKHPEKSTNLMLEKETYIGSNIQRKRKTEEEIEGGKIEFEMTKQRSK